MVPNNAGPGTLVGDLDPDRRCCSGTPTVSIGGKNIGDLLSAQGVTWGAFMGGFDLTVKNSDGSTGCSRQSPASPASGGPTTDYIPHHAFFQYFASTANPQHTRASSPVNIGTSYDGGANHQYDLHDFFDALAVGNMPAVSFLKAIAAGTAMPAIPTRCWSSRSCWSDDQCDHALAVLEEHRHRCHVRRFGRMVRPSDEPDRQSVIGAEHRFAIEWRPVERAG